MSLSQLDAAFFWPEDELTRLLRPALEARDPGLLPQSVVALLKARGVVIEPGAESHFPLREIEPGLFANSSRAKAVARALEPTDGTRLTVIDSLCRNEIDALDLQGGFVYLGDRHGGFYAPETSSKNTPCPRCLLLRYISNRQGSQALYELLLEGERVVFPPNENPDPASFLQVTSDSLLLPLPTCQECCERFERWPEEISAGPFSALSSHQVNGLETSVKLPQMIWLCGLPTVGFGSSWDENPSSGEVRAVHEALERYSAHFASSEDGVEGFRFVCEGSERLFSSRQTYLIEPGSLSTGLACRRALCDAVQDGLQEVCERDALARFWLRVCRGEAAASTLGSESIEGAQIEFLLLDSYGHPTVLALGRTHGGSLFLGSACSSIEPAREKARREAMQIKALFEGRKSEAVENPQTFLQHGALYWTKPELFPKIKRGRVDVRPLERDIYHRDITSPDLRRCGYVVVRVVVPGLLKLPQAHEDWFDILREANSQDAPPPLPHPFT